MLLNSERLSLLNVNYVNSNCKGRGSTTGGRGTPHPITPPTPNLTSAQPLPHYPSSQLRSIYAIVTRTLDNIHGVLHYMQTTDEQTRQLHYPVFLSLYLSLFFTRDP